MNVLKKVSKYLLYFSALSLGAVFALLHSEKSNGLSSTQLIGDEQSFGGNGLTHADGPPGSPSDSAGGDDSAASGGGDSSCATSTAGTGGGTGGGG